MQNSEDHTHTSTEFIWNVQNLNFSYLGITYLYIPPQLTSHLFIQLQIISKR